MSSGSFFFFSQKIMCLTSLRSQSNKQTSKSTYHISPIFCSSPLPIWLLLILSMKLTVSIKGQLLPCVLHLSPSHLFKMSPYTLFSFASSGFHFPLTNIHQHKNRPNCQTNKKAKPLEITAFS